ncbi:MAG: hypothetical protein AB1758_09615, partial [Candidatus Eremiobacterota bacterium]
MSEHGPTRQRLDRALEGVRRAFHVLTDPGHVRVNETPRRQILGVGKLRVLRYLRQTPPAHPVPLLLVPPFLVKPYIFDLHPGRSLAAFWLERGFDVFLVDFGIPDETDLHVRFDDYVLNYLPKTVDAIGLETGQARVSMLGYCVGGLFCLLYGATVGRPRLANLILLATPVDYGKMGLVSMVAQKAHREIEFLIDKLGNVPGVIPALGMQVANPLSVVTRYVDLFTHAVNEEFVQSWHSLSAWMHDFIPGPRDAYKEFFQDYVVSNNLLTGAARVGGEPADLKR